MLPALPPTQMPDGTWCDHRGQTSTYCTHCWTNLWQALHQGSEGTNGGQTKPSEAEDEGKDDLFGSQYLVRHAVTRVRARTWLQTTFIAMTLLMGCPVALSFLAAMLNALFFLSIVWWVDLYEEEPWQLITRTFRWGACVAVLLAAIGEILLIGALLLFLDSAQTKWLVIGFLGPIVEELCKGAVLVKLFRRHREEFDGRLDGLVYGAIVGLGFSMTENTMYFLSAAPRQLATFIIVRGLLLGMNHACFSACFGFGLGIAREAPHSTRRLRAPVAGLLAGISLHIGNNLLALTDARLVLPWLGCAVFVWFRLAKLAQAREARWINEELADEVDAGALSADEAAAVSDPRKRRATLSAALEETRCGAARSRQRLYALATELAFAKHKAKIDGAPSYTARIEILRQQIARVRAKHLTAGWLTNEADDRSTPRAA